MGVRLALRRAQADAGDIALLYADESEALTHPCLAHAWAERGADLRVQAPGQSRKVALPGEPLGSTMGALDAGTGELVVSTSPTKASADFIAFLRRLDWRYGPKPGCDRLPVVLVLVLDNGPIHTSKASRAALAGRPWITVEWLPRHAPELNAIERTWRDLKRHHLAHRTVKDAADLTCAIHAAVKQLNKERQTPHPCDRLNKAA
jgi:transposase